MTNVTKMNGSARKIIRCVLSVVVDMQQRRQQLRADVEDDQDASVAPVALSVRS